MLGHSLVRHVDLKPPAARRRWNADTPIGPDMTNRSPRSHRTGGSSLPRATTHPESRVGFEARACNHLRITPVTKLVFVIAVPQENDPRAANKSRFTPHNSSFFKHQRVTKNAALLQFHEFVPNGVLELRSDCCSQAICVRTATGVPWSEFRAIQCPVHMYVAWTRGQRITSQCHHAVHTL